MRKVALVGAVMAGATLVCCLGPAAYFLGGIGTPPPTAAVAFAGCGRPGTVIDPNARVTRLGLLTNEQMRNAATIIAVGQRMNVPPRGWVIAIATSLQETNLRNLPVAVDHDSLGLFQQRPNQGWGTAAQILDPVHASTAFYEHLLKVRGWDTLSLTDAAQAVQRSAFPDAYARHEPLAARLVDQLASGAARSAGGIGQCAGSGAIAASGWTVPVSAAIVSGFRPPSRPTHNGVDLAVGKGTPIHAAASGIVRTVRCNVSAGDCDHDGSPAIQGCGWYVDIAHAGGIITRYCHQLRQPLVRPGQAVTVGQVIGVSGTSGNSSGPHLHFEVHINGDASNAGAVNPVPFMADKGAPLGKS